MCLEKALPRFVAVRGFLWIFFWFSCVFIILWTGVPWCSAAVPRDQPAVGDIARAGGDAQIWFVRENEWLHACKFGGQNT